MAQPGQFGVVGDLAGADQLLEPDRQGHQTGDAGHPARRPFGIAGRLDATDFFPGTTPTAAKLDDALDGDWSGHVGFSVFWLARSSASVLMPFG